MRRTRIKGIANIPQRKKTDLPPKVEGEDKNKAELSTKEELKVNSSVVPDLKAEDQNENVAAARIIINEEIIKKPNTPTDPVNNVVPKADSAPLKQTTSSEISLLNNIVIQNAKDNKSLSINIPEIGNDEESIAITKKRSSIVNPAIEDKVFSDVQSIIQSDKASGISEERQLFENAAMDNTVLSDVESDKSSVISEKTQLIVNAAVDNTPLSDFESIAQSEKSSAISERSRSSSSFLTIDSKQEKKSEIETFLQPPKSPLNLSIGKKLVGSSDIKRVISPHPSVGSDTEYPIPPASPNKMNRSRIKAIPRIGYRKISFSASESEDESKKVNYRTRNDSQSSNVSGVAESIVDLTTSAPKVKEFSSVIQRKCKRTEWSRKLAEARREFNKKFNSEKPDHKKLTMIDLIFYNPTTNPMVKENKKSISESDPKAEEDVDNPSEKEDDPAENEKEEDKAKTSDEENEAPAPQIKIGPAGEIILDEKSLVIENKQTKKNREEMQKSQVVDGNSDRPYGVFKRVKRSKDWSHLETLRFYKALNTIGTDFSLMCELFPKRTRRELKMKFKKEERINQALIDKAVMQPCGFDFAELKKEFELAEIELEELENQKLNEEKLRKNKRIKKSVKFLKMTKENNPDKKSEETESNVEIIESELERPRERSEEPVLEKIKRKKDKTSPDISTKKKLDILSVLSDSDSINTDSDDMEFTWRPTQTRYGRKTRKREIYDPVPSLEELIPRKIAKPTVENEPQQKPGSIMMVSSETPEGQPVVQIYMVTENAAKEKNTENLLPIAMIRGGQTTDEEENEEKEEEIVENNYTIPADAQTGNNTIENKS